MGRLRPGRHRYLGDIPGLRGLAVILVGLSSGCSGNAIQGTIDGFPVKVRSAFYFAEPDAMAEDDLVTVVMTDLKNGCQDYGFYLESTDEMVEADDLASAWAAVFPPDFWEVAIILRVSDAAVPLDGVQLVGIDWDETLEQRNHGFASVVHNRAMRDAAFFDGSGPTDDYLDGYLSRGGRVEISKHVPGSFIRGNFGTEMVDREEGETKGLVKMKFNAAFCDVDIL